MAEGWLRWSVALFLLVALGGAFRWLAMESTFPTRPTGDEVYYLSTAINIAQGTGLEFGAHRYRASWPPAQSWWLAQFVDAEAADPRLILHLAKLDPDAPDPRLSSFLRPLIIAQLVLGTLLVAVTGLLGLALFGPRVGLASAAVAAVYPTFVANSHYLWSETLFAVLLTGALAAAVAAQRRGGFGWVIGSGLLFGAAGLTREIAIPCAAAVAAWWVWGAGSQGRRRALVWGALLLLVACAVVAPWTVRNYRLFGRLVPVATVGWHAMREGNTLGEWAEVRRFRERYYAIEDEMERMDLARREALALIADAQPGWVFRKAAKNLPLLFSPHSIGFYKIRQGTYGASSPVGVRAFLVMAVLAYAGVVVAGVLGIAGASGGRRALPLLLFGALVAVHIVSNANSRYRVPFMPLLIVYGCTALLGWSELRGRLEGRRLAAPLLVLAVFVAVCVPPFVPEALKVWNHPVATRAAGDSQP